MNEETTLPAEMPSDPEPSVAPETDAEDAAKDLNGALIEGTIYEDLSGANYEETTAQVICLDDLQSIANYNAHVDLFGSFLVCGTLVGLALLRDRHGN